MDIRFQVGGPSLWKAEAVMSFICDGEGPEQACPELCHSALWLSIAPAWRDFHGEKDRMVMLYGPQAMEIPRVLGIGLGKLGEGDAESFRFALGRAMRCCRDYGLKHVGMDCASLSRVAKKLGLSLPEIAREAVVASLMSLYRYDKWLSKKSGHEDPLSLSLLLSSGFAENDLRSAVRMAEAEAAGIVLARDLANAPANEMSPMAFAGMAEKTARRHGMAFRRLVREDLKKEGMEAYLAVAKGSEEPPCMAVVEYMPKGTEGEAPIVLVGKGICFDSGGISLKPAKGMEAMKADMSGSAAVLGVMEALGQLAYSSLAPAQPVVAVMACAENMPGGHATRPGDIVRARNGLSIEIVNTDAEGRLVLADALAWAVQQYKPACVIDIATLTGACEVALGKRAAGLFSSDDKLAESLHRSGMALGERNWRLPLWEKSSLEVLKSSCADLKNSGAREGGALHAAAFLRQFVGAGIPWAHIDMAGADGDDSPINAEGCTGFGVRTLLSAALG
ncbi:MAG: leucyl aminopeptidase [Mailhella sp.]|nr:leucyl aminopeptidase [Mailhella sp.]